MAEWRSKMMAHPEWDAFQNEFEKLWSAFGFDRRMALLSRKDLGDDEYTVLIPPLNSELVERLSPGGWGDYENPHAVNWQVLRWDANNDFGLTIGS